jgi:hypothetical protein
MHWRMDTVLHKRGHAMTTTACKGLNDHALEGLETLGPRLASR